jgi:hypothetical protein
LQENYSLMPGKDEETEEKKAILGEEDRKLAIEFLLRYIPTRIFLFLIS